jgi:rhodanese-related sulfurtransferase
MNHEVYVIDGLRASNFNVVEPWRDELPPHPEVREIGTEALSHWLADAPQDTLLLDFTSGVNYKKRHIAGAWFALRSELAAVLSKLAPDAKRVVLTCGSSLLARYVAADVRALTNLPVHVLTGGTQAWAAAGLPLEEGPTRLASPLIDRYRRPYEGTDNQDEAMQAYLDWEFGLVEQLGRDGTHGFVVV